MACCLQSGFLTKLCSLFYLCTAREGAVIVPVLFTFNHANRNHKRNRNPSSATPIHSYILSNHRFPEGFTGSFSTPALDLHNDNASQHTRALQDARIWAASTAAGTPVITPTYQSPTTTSDLELISAETSKCKVPINFHWAAHTAHHASEGQLQTSLCERGHHRRGSPSGK